VERRANEAFAVWVTGLPASGKSTVVRALKAQLATRGVSAEVLESDALRRIFTPHPRYEEQEREIFYAQVAFVGGLLAKHGIPVIFDATANRRAYRNVARRTIPCFLEVYVDTPLAECMNRDPKGIYRKALGGGTGAVPGLKAEYEPPEHPDVVVHGDRETPETAARRVIEALEQRSYLDPG
jgi:adenylylsulfate kinase